MKKKWLDRLGMLLLVVLLVASAGCLRSKGNVIVNNLPSDLRLEREGTLRLRVFSDLEDSEGCCGDIRDALAALLRERNVFGEVVFDRDGSGKPAGMALEVKIVTLRKVGTTGRLLLGKYKGQARVVTENRLFDEADGKEVGSFIIDGESSLKSVIPALSGTTRQALKRVSEQIADVLQLYVK
jgi:hypothetical protein